MFDLMLRSPFGSLFGQLERELAESGIRAPRGFAPAAECALDGKDYLVRLALPGVDPKDVDISVTDGMLSVKGQSKADDEKTRYFVREFVYGPFERSFTLPDGVNAGQIKARFDKGILLIHIPGPVEPAPVKISIATEGSK